MSNLTVQEVTRNTSAGRFSYVMYQGKVARRAFRRGRPHYDIVAGINLGANEEPKSKEITADSQLGRLFLTGEVKKTRQKTEVVAAAA